MGLLFLLCFGFVLAIDAGVSHREKCCPLNQYMKRMNLFDFKCEEYESKRYQLVSDSVLGDDNGDGHCVEAVDDGFYIFELKNGTIKIRERIKDKYFPKCCPLNFIYNTVNRSCEPKEELPRDFINGHYVTVGLPKCQIILDRNLNVSIGELNLQVDNREYGSFCVDVNDIGSFTIRECQKNLNICEKKRCVKKCCPDGQSFVGGSVCRDTHVHGFRVDFSENVENPTDEFQVLYNTKCPSVYLLDPKKVHFTVDTKGTFKYWDNLTSSFVSHSLGNKHSYCIDYAFKGSINGFKFFGCLHNQIPEKFQYTFWAKIISAVSLMLTIIVYVLLKETRNTFGKVLVNCCFSNFCLLTILLHGNQDLNPSFQECKVRGYSIIFFGTATFSWLNIVCIDIWCAFGSPRKQNNEGNRSKYVWYLCYGWGLPLLWSAVILLFDFSKILPDFIQPYIGHRKCLFESHEGNYAELLFFHLPRLIIQIVNIALFARTVMYYVQVKSEINKINDTRRKTKTAKLKSDLQQLTLIFKLTIVMGVSLTFEVVSGFVDMNKVSKTTKYIEVVWDLITCLQGFFIFLLFICKRKILADLCKKFRIRRRFPTSTTSETMSGIHLTHVNSTQNGKNM